MGHWMGLFHHTWLGLPATRTIARSLYAEYLRIVDGTITDTARSFDIPQLMMQAGLQHFPVQTGGQLVQQGP